MSIEWILSFQHDSNFSPRSSRIVFRTDFNMQKFSQFDCFFLHSVHFLSDLVASIFAFCGVPILYLN